VTDAVTNNLTGNVTTVNEASSSGGLGGGLIAAIIIIILVVVGFGFWFALNLAGKYCPDSKIGKRFNDWKASRALSKEQAALAAKDKSKLTSFTNHTNASDDGSSQGKNEVIL